MELRRIEINTDLTKEEAEVIESIEKKETAIIDITTKKEDLEVEIHDLIYKNPIAILKHDLAIMEGVYDLLSELKGTYDSDNDLVELSEIKWEIMDKLEGFKKELPEGTFKEETVEI